jgi:hypothetical protein
MPLLVCRAPLSWEVYIQCWHRGAAGCALSLLLLLVPPQVACCCSKTQQPLRRLLWWVSCLAE